MISLSVMVLQMRNTMLVIIDLNFLLTFFCNRNFCESITKVYIQKFYKRYKSNKYR